MYGTGIERFDAMRLAGWRRAMPALNLRAPGERPMRRGENENRNPNRKEAIQ